MAIPTVDTSGLPEYTAAEMLKLCNAAIAAIMNGNQSYTIGSQSYTKADLPSLMRMRDQFKAEVADEDSSISDIAAVRFE